MLSWMTSNVFKSLLNDSDVTALAEQIFHESDLSVPEHIQETSMLLLRSLILYLWKEAPCDEQNAYMLVELLVHGVEDEDSYSEESDLDRLISMLEEKKETHTAVSLYYQAKEIAGDDFQEVIKNCLKMLSAFHIRRKNFVEYFERIADGDIENGGALIIGRLIAEHIGDDAEYRCFRGDDEFNLLSIKEAEGNFVASLIAYAYTGRLDLALRAFDEEDVIRDPLAPINELINQRCSENYAEKIQILGHRYPDHSAVKYYRQFAKKAGPYLDEVQSVCEDKLSFWNYKT
jgi:hypothetical protein